MIKILSYSMVFFALEAVLLLGGQNVLFRQYAVNAPVFYNCQSRAQQLPTDAIISAHTINASKEGGRVILGGSSSQVFVAVINYLEDPELRAMLHRGDTGSQKFWDSLRIIDNLDHPNASAVLVLHPRKFLNSDSRNAITRSNYNYGLSGSFPINSEAYEDVVTTLEAANGADADEQLGGGLGAFKKHLFFPINFYAQAARECVDEAVDHRLVKPFENWQAASKLTLVDEQDAVAAAPEVIEAFGTEAGEAASKNLPWKQQAVAFRKWIANASEPERRTFRYAESLALLEQLLETAERRGVRLVIADAPLSEVHRNELMPFMPTFYDDIEELVGKFETADYIRFDQGSVPDNMPYFIDALHLTPEGWQKFYFDYLTDAITHGLKPLDAGEKRS